jgi:hypothetical protein
MDTHIINIQMIAESSGDILTSDELAREAGAEFCVNAGT